MSFLSFNRLGLLIFLFLISGCADNPRGLVPLQGKVTINGISVKAGSINFRPMGNQEHIGASAAPIIGGNYSIPAAKGAMPGEYRVEIFASEDTGQVDSEGMPISRSLIPTKYNDNSELTITVAKGKSYDFDLVFDEADFKKK